MVSFIHHDHNTSFFSAKPLTNAGTLFNGSASKPFEQVSYLNELSDASDDGMFAWQALKSDEFFLIYANPAFLTQASLTPANLGQTYEEIFSVKDAFVPHSQLDKCVKAGLPVKYNHECAEKTFCVSLYPVCEDDRITRIVGTSIDFTEQAGRTYQLECLNKQLVHSDQLLREQVKFEALIARVSRDYMDAGHAGFSACTDELVAGLGELLEVDWACVWKNQDTICEAISQWHADRDAEDTHLIHNVFSSEFCSSIKQFRSGRIVVINDLELEKPQLCSSFINAAKRQSLRSVLIVPILRGSDFWGVISVSQQNEKRVWTTVEISRLKIAADTIMSAYLRMKTEKQLNESNRVLVEYDESLQDMLAVQETLASVSSQYTIMDSQHFASRTKEMLEALAGLTDVDHACIHVSNNGSFVSYEWCKKGLPYIDLRKHNILPTSGWMDLFRDRELLTVSNAAEEKTPLPPFLMEKIVSLGIKSFMVIPLRVNDTLWGALILSKVLGCHNWNNTSIDTAKQFADVFLGAYIRHYKEQQLIKENETHSALLMETVKQNEILYKVARSAQLFFDATSESLKDVFGSVCQEVAAPLQIQSFCLTRYSEASAKSSVVFDWCSSVRLSKRMGGTLSHHGTALSVPVMYREAVWGSLIVNIASEKPNDACISALELMAQYCVGAYMRIHPERQACFSPDKERAFRKALTLAAQSAGF
jgi:GAF domain-containing protein